MNDISPEMVERMAQLVRGLAASDNWGPFATLSDVVQEALTIVALLPAPVDPDLIEARKMVAELLAGDYPKDYLSGARDEWSNVQLALSAIKRGRELAESGK